MTEQYLHFSVGPVQSFIGEARRTRDFWAGSFLLSWLSGVAMATALEKGATLISPIVGDKASVTGKNPLLDAVRGQSQNVEYEAQLVNQFRAHVNDPQSVAKAYADSRRGRSGN